MNGQCKHGLDLDHCSICDEEFQSEAILGQPLYFSGGPVFLLRSLHHPNRAKILRLHADPPITTIPSNELGLLDVPTVRRQELIEEFAAFVADRGFLFIPNEPLTSREQGPDGPTHCYYDRRTLSISMGSLGCTHCRYYVCSCGRCLCGYAGENYMGQAFSLPPLPLPLHRRDRVEYMRVFGYSKGATQGGKDT